MIHYSVYGNTALLTGSLGKQGANQGFLGLFKKTNDGLVERILVLVQPTVGVVGHLSALTSSLVIQRTHNF